jgi:hypothetical protein
MKMSSLRIFQILKSKIGEEESEALLGYVDTTLKDNRKELYEAIRSTFATKEDLSNVKGQLEVKIAEVKSDVIRWVFAFIVAVLLAILGLYFKK